MIRSKTLTYHEDINVDGRDPSYGPRLSKIPRLRLDGLDTPCGIEEHLVFSYYGFLQLEHLCAVPPGDVRFLEFKGSLHVPTKPILNEFTREYFLHVHPNLPLLDERAFWTTYEGTMLEREKRVRISLFLFQAMLFSSCGVGATTFCIGPRSSADNDY